MQDHLDMLGFERNRRARQIADVAAGCDQASIPIVVVSFPGVRGKHRWVAAVPVINEMVAEVRKRIPADAIVELSDQRLSPEQAAKLNLMLGDVRCID
jgi:hypothetical protein